MMEYKEIDDSNLAQCCDCGYVMNKDEVPTVRVSWIFDDPVDYCPECESCDCIGDYDPERAKRLEKKNDIK